MSRTLSTSPDSGGLLELRAQAFRLSFRLLGGSWVVRSGVIRSLIWAKLRGVSDKFPKPQTLSPGAPSFKPEALNLTP